MNVPLPLLRNAPSPVVFVPDIVPPLCIVTVTVLVRYSVCVAAVIAPYRFNPPPVTTIRESAPRLMLPRHVVAPLVVLRSAPFPAFVPVPYRFSVAGRHVWLPLSSSVALVPTFTMPLVPIALVLPSSLTVPFSTQIAPANVLLFVSTTMLFCFTAMPPAPEIAPLRFNAFPLLPQTSIQLDFR